jgi:hypothetical protein
MKKSIAWSPAQQSRSAHDHDRGAVQRRMVLSENHPMAGEIRGNNLIKKIECPPQTGWFVADTRWNHGAAF